MKKILILCLSTVLAFSCTDTLDTTPGDATTDANFPTSVGDLNQMVLGTYSAYPGRSIVQASSIISDDVRIAPTNTGQGAFLYNWTYTSTEGDFEAIWDGCYRSVNRANQVINNLGRVTPSSDNQGFYNQIASEAYGMRALGHFILLQTFGAAYAPSNAGVPFVTSLSIEQQPARDTSGDVMDLIKADIATALTFSDASGTQDRTKMNHFAIKALKAKVAMWEGDYPTVISESNDILAAYSVTSAGQFSGLWNDTVDTSIIFEIGKDATNAGDNASGDLGGIYTRSSNGDIFYNPSDEIVNLYEAGDIRPNIYFSGSGFTAQVTKYANSEGQTGLNDIKVFRAEDILLMRAEAKVRNASVDLVGAQSDVNILLSNRGVSNTSFGSSAIALDFIYNERRRELAYEGHRLYDAKRFGLFFDREPVDCINISNCTLDNVNRYTYPIPQSEIFANNNMVQNPGYN